MEYYYYEDDSTNWVRVHEGSCRYCNHGQGRQGSRLPDNRWRGPYASPDLAMDNAQATGKYNVNYCGHCLRRYRTQ